MDKCTFPSRDKLWKSWLEVLRKIEFLYRIPASQLDFHENAVNGSFSIEIPRKQARYPKKINLLCTDAELKVSSWLPCNRWLSSCGRWSTLIAMLNAWRLRFIIGNSEWIVQETPSKGACSSNRGIIVSPIDCEQRKWFQSICFYRVHIDARAELP